MKTLILVLALVPNMALAQVTANPIPSVDPALADYQPAASGAGLVRSVGSSTLSNLLLRWSAEFRRLYPSVDLQVTGGAQKPRFPRLSKDAPTSGR